MTFPVSNASVGIWLVAICSIVGCNRPGWSCYVSEPGLRLDETVISLLFGSVVGPALTFRIRHNEQNLSLADVTQQAGKYHLVQAPVPNKDPPSGLRLLLLLPLKQSPRPATCHAMIQGWKELHFCRLAGLVKSELETQTGLQILQTGMGQVCVCVLDKQSP